MKQVDKLWVALHSALRSLVPAITVVVTLVQTGVVKLEDMFTWRGIVAIVNAIELKGAVSGLSAKSVSVVDKTGKQVL